MNLFRVILSWMSIAGGSLLFVLEIAAFVISPADEIEWAGGIAGLLLGGALFLSGLLMLKRRTAGRYLFSVCLIFVVFPCFLLLKFFSEPLVLSPSFQPISGPAGISWNERAHLLWKEAPDNIGSLSGIFGVLAGCISLSILVHSRRFKENFKRKPPSP